jgi:hypothetical protein
VPDQLTWDEKAHRWQYPSAPEANDPVFPRVAGCQKPLNG